MNLAAVDVNGIDPKLCIHHVVEEQARQRPEALALSCGLERLTYRQLNQRANQLAHHLRRHGVGPNTTVALCLERSLNMIVAILGVLKAGGAYVPVDLAYPKARLSFMLEDTKAPVLLTQQSLLDCLPAHSAKVICLDGAWDEISGESAENPDTQTTGENTAYIIFTSGSTGQPKGVLVTHRNVVRLFSSTDPWYHFNSTDVWTLFHSYAFDFSVWEIWGALFYGGRLVVVPYLLSRSPEGFYELLGQERVTVLNQTPSAFRQLMWAEDCAQQRHPLTLRYVIFGGEALELQSLKPWFERHGDEHPLLVNMYGITETTVHATYRPIQLADLGKGLRSVIGVPLPDLQIYLLDENHQPVAAGEIGEIFIGGAGVAQGYLNQPELTSQRFIPDPFSRKPGDRLYRSGDLAKYVANGELEYLGRADFQIKIRGFRIELGEIEAALNQHPTIQQSAVIASDTSGPDKRLIAYLVAQGGRPSVTELREHLEKHIPEYMIPAAFVFLSALPLTPNGKLDRRALPAPDHDRPVTQTAYTAPHPGMEQALVAVWSQVLEIEPIGVNDNFFEMGGDSLLATQVVSRIRHVLHREVCQRDLFEHPTIAQLRAVFESRKLSEETVIQRVPRGADLPTSFAQQRLWFLDQLEPGGVAYLLQQGLQLTGPLEPRILERSLNEIVRRHEPLRTVFPDHDGGPWQRILPNASVELEQIDLRQLPEAQRKAQATKLTLEESTRPIDLKQGPIFRARLLRRGEQDHILLLTLHHITADGWSFGVLLNELSVLYPAFLAGQTSPLPELLIQYADFAAWQRERLAKGAMEALSGYWKNQLTEAPPLSSLPTDYPRPQKQSHQGSTLPVSIAASLTEPFKRLCQEEGCTLFMGLLAAFQVVVYRHTGQSDLLIGSPIANRNRAEIEGLIGCFFNTLVLRTDLSGEPSFRQLLRRVREMTLEAYTHQDMPFEKLVEEIQPTRDPSYSPLFQLMFILQNTPVPAAAIGKIASTAFEGNNGTTDYDLTLALNEGPGGISGEIEYVTDLFKAGTIQRLLGHWIQLLTGAVAQPDSPITRLPLISTQERHQLLEEWKRTRKEYPENQCVHQQVEIQAAATPEALAVECDGAALTYRQLNEQANQLAHLLRSMGVSPGTPVGVCLRRSLEMIVGILGILKAGGAYVPLDPDYPGERLAYMLQDSKAPLAVTDQEHAASKKLSALGTKLLYLDFDLDLLRAQSRANPPPVAGPGDLIYIIYTSGSTGRPKGAAVYHRGFANLLHWFLTEFDMTSADRVLLVSAQGFDLTQKNIFAPLMRGGPLHLLPPRAYDPARILGLIEKQHITLINCTPSAFYPLIESSDSGAFRKIQSLRCVFLGGEPIVKARLRPWLDNPCCRAELANTYGPTECSDISGFHRVTRANLDRLDFIPLGRPISNVSLAIVDSHQGLCPIGVAGELYIGGEGVGAGYFNDPALTASRFIQSPFPEIPNMRWYKSGDLARYLPDGNVEYLGRLDHQVKIRGFRIELGEIETILRQHPNVREIVVVARDDGPNEKRLDAFFLAKAQPAPAASDLREFVKKVLPDYMVPSVFVPLEALPLSPNGKVDRKALPAPELVQGEKAWLPPRDALDRQLVKIWESIFKRTQIGIRDNFFELGGHSLLAVRLFMQVEQITGEKLPLATLFQAPTIETLADILHQKGWKPPWLCLVPIKPTGAKPPFYCVHGVGGNILEYLDLAKYMDSDQPFYGVQAIGLSGKHPWQHSVEEMAATYVKEIREFQPEGPYYLGGSSFGGLVAFEMAKLLQADHQEVRLLAFFDTHAPGYPKFLPATSRWRAQMNRWRFRCSLHWDNLVVASGKERFVYVWTKLKKYSYGRYLMFRRFCNQTRGRIEQFFWPKEITQTRQAGLHAFSNYQPEKYSGSATVFRATVQPQGTFFHPTLGWSDFIEGELEVYETPGHHGSIVRDPRARTLASQLSESLRKAQIETF